MLILNDLAPLPWPLAGAGIALISLLLLWTTNTVFGVSTGLENLCALFSRQPYFQRPKLQGDGNWRLVFFVGLILGGALSALLSGGWAPIWDLGIWDLRVAPVLGGGAMVKLAWMFGGGLLIGLGTRIGRGCTSGHGISGLSRLQPASLLSVLAFLGTAILTANLLFRLIFTA
jgi:uncharacterized membrane protein YedE/YeeE